MKGYLGLLLDSVPRSNYRIRSSWLCKKSFPCQKTVNSKYLFLKTVFIILSLKHPKPFSQKQKMNCSETPEAFLTRKKNQNNSRRDSLTERSALQCQNASTILPPCFSPCCGHCVLLGES
uniref:Uncharacterized protein n=1 Tax=Micrurus spixii TaxID=129469 RepID=A0A2D4NF30_9SAUR